MLFSCSADNFPFAGPLKKQEIVSIFNFFNKNIILYLFIKAAYNIMEEDEVVYEESEGVHITAIESLKQRALSLAEVSYDVAFEIDDGKPLWRRIGEFNIITIGEKFYHRVYRDTDESFRMLFTRNEDDMAQDFSDYLLQRLGGKVEYSKGKGPCALSTRHSQVKIDSIAARRWLMHMYDTLEELQEDEEIDRDTGRKLMNFFKYTAFYLVACTEVHSDIQSSKTFECPMNPKYHVKACLPKERMPYISDK